MSQVQMPDLALSPEKSLSPNPLYPDYAPHGAILPTLEEKTQKGGMGAWGVYGTAPACHIPPSHYKIL